MHVETLWVADNTPVELEIWKGEPDKGEKLETVSGKKIEKCELICKHKPNIKEQDLEGKEFIILYFKVKIDKYKLEDVSTSMKVVKIPFSS